MSEPGNRTPQDGDAPDLLPFADDVRSPVGTPSAGAGGEADEGLEPEDSTAAMYARARQCSDAGETREAIAIYRALLAREPRHVRARNNLALLLEKSGDVRVGLVLTA